MHVYITQLIAILDCAHELALCKIEYLMATFIVCHMIFTADSASRYARDHDLNFFSLVEKKFSRNNIGAMSSANQFDLAVNGRSGGCRLKLLAKSFKNFFFSLSALTIQPCLADPITKATPAF